MVLLFGMVGGGMCKGRIDVVVTAVSECGSTSWTYEVPYSYAVAGQVVGASGLE